MHNLTALSLALPGTPLHGLNDFEPRAGMAAASLRTAPRTHEVPATGARRRPRSTRGRRFALRVGRPAPN